jgi:hypothetical protein
MEMVEEEEEGSEDEEQEDDDEEEEEGEEDGEEEQGSEHSTPEEGVVDDELSRAAVDRLRISSDNASTSSAVDPTGNDEDAHDEDQDDDEDENEDDDSDNDAFASSSRHRRRRRGSIDDTASIATTRHHTEKDVSTIVAASLNRERRSQHRHHNRSRKDVSNTLGRQKGSKAKADKKRGVKDALQF